MDYCPLTFLSNLFNFGKTGSPRSSLFITTKVPPANQCPGGQATPQCSLDMVKTDLQQLSMPFVDLVLLHHPSPTDAENVALWQGLEQAMHQVVSRRVGVPLK